MAERGIIRSVDGRRYVMIEVMHPFWKSFSEPSTLVAELPPCSWERTSIGAFWVLCKLLMSFIDIGGNVTKHLPIIVVIGVQDCMSTMYPIIQIQGEDHSLQVCIVTLFIEVCFKNEILDRDGCGRRCGCTFSSVGDEGVKRPRKLLPHCSKLDEAWLDAWAYGKGHTGHTRMPLASD